MFRDCCGVEEGTAHQAWCPWNPNVEVREKAKAERAKIVCCDSNGDDWNGEPIVPALALSVRTDRDMVVDGRRFPAGSTTPADILDFAARAGEQVRRINADEIVAILDDAGVQRNAGYIAVKICELIEAGGLRCPALLATPDPTAGELIEAFKGVMPLLERAESNASGNPEWDFVGPRVATARATLAKFS